MNPTTLPAASSNLGGSPAIHLSPDTRGLAQRAQQLGLLPNFTRQTLRLFADGTSPTQIGQAYADDTTQLTVAGYDGPVTPRRLVVDALNLAGVEFGNILTRRNALSTSGAFPSRDGIVADVYFEGTERPVDVSWRLLFDVRDWRGTNEEDFEVVNIKDAVTFRVYNAGERVELTGIEGNVAKFPFQLVGGGFQYSQTWLDDSKFWRIADGLSAMDTGYGNTMSRLAWQILTAATGLVATVRDAGGANNVARDVNTVNAGMTEILAAMHDADDFTPGSPAFVLAYNSLSPGYAARVAAMLAASYGAANSDIGGVALQYPVTPVGSPDVPQGGLYLAFPGRKNKAGIRMDLTKFEHFDPLVYAGARPGWGRYTIVRGDANQVRFIPLS